MPWSGPSGTQATRTYDGVVIITEYGIADLRGLGVRNKALAIAKIAHPSVRDDLLRTVYDDPMITKPYGFTLDKIPYGVTLYQGNTRID